MDINKFNTMGKPFDLNQVEQDNDHKIDGAVQGLKQVDYDSEARAKEIVKKLRLEDMPEVYNFLKTQLDVAYLHGQMQAVKAKMNDLRVVTGK